MSIHVNAEHGIICRRDDPMTNYFGWPTVAVLEDGTVVAASSGLRSCHLDPWGKIVLHFSHDGGKTFEEPVIAHNDKIDNRDAGIIPLGGQKFAVTWFSSDTRPASEEQLNNLRGTEPGSPAWNEWVRRARDYMADWDNDTVDALLGSWLKITGDGGKTWTRPIRVPVTAPHGFAVMADGSFGYLGKRYTEEYRTLGGTLGPVQYVASKDGGFTWEVRGTVPTTDTKLDVYHEPHVIQLKNGRLMGCLRVEQEAYGTKLTFSDDGGYTWTEPGPLMTPGGLPSHLMRHSSGAIIMSYGYRYPGFGSRAVISCDEGETWSDEIILREDGSNGDLGYAASAELPNGDMITVYYQRVSGDVSCSLQCSRWTLPKL